MAKFFIERPIFAWVIALFVMVLGAVAITQLPVAQYPSVAPPSIVVSASYPGATATTLENSVLSVIEREMNGSPGLIYMESVAQANGSGTITLSFEPGTNAELAQVDVQNRLGRAALDVFAEEPTPAARTLPTAAGPPGCARGASSPSSSSTMRVNESNSRSERSRRSTSAVFTISRSPPRDLSAVVDFAGCGERREATAAVTPPALGELALPSLSPRDGSLPPAAATAFLRLC